MGVRRGLGVVTLVLGLATAGCADVGSGADVDLGGTWALVSGRVGAEPLEVTSHTHVTLTFDDEGMGGTAPCNDYGAAYELDGSSFDVTGPGIEQTLAGCGEEPEALESAYLSALTEVDTVARDGDTLTMTGEGVELELRLEAPRPRADVVNQRWRLVSWKDDAGVEHRPTWRPGLRPFVRFGDSGGVGGRVSASTGCRVLEGRWRTWRGAPRIVRAEWRGACPDRMLEQEVAVGNALGEPSIELRGGGYELVLRHAHANSPGEVVYRR